MKGNDEEDDRFAVFHAGKDNYKEMIREREVDIYKSGLALFTGHVPT